MIGRRIGYYTIIAPVAGDETGARWLARDDAGRIAALKAVPPALCGAICAALHDDPEAATARALWARIDAVLRLAHPGIARTFVVKLSREEAIFIQEAIDGPTLADVVREAGRIAPAKVVEVALQILAALAHARAAGAGPHGDVRPSTAVVDRSGWVKLLDWGVAPLAGRERPDVPAVLELVRAVAAEVPPPLARALEDAGARGTSPGEALATIRLLLP